MAMKLLGKVSVDGVPHVQVQFPESCAMFVDYIIQACDATRPGDFVPAKFIQLWMEKMERDRGTDNRVALEALGRIDTSLAKLVTSPKPGKSATFR